MKRTVIGLTGGIACGKTQVSNMLESFGYSIVDTDVISRKVMNSKDCALAVLSAFPECNDNGELNRSALREVVFNDESKRKLLNSIVHPYIYEYSKNELKRGDGVAFFVVPLLFESGFDSLCDYTVAVVCDEEKREERLVDRDGISLTLARKMISSQLTDKERSEKADFIIENRGDMEELRKNVLAFVKKIEELNK